MPITEKQREQRRNYLGSSDAPAIAGVDPWRNPAYTVEEKTFRVPQFKKKENPNLRYGSRIVGEDDKWVIAQGMAHDLETNVAMTIEVRQRITDKYGKRYLDDMVVVTANTACAIALRNAIFKVVPKTFVDSIYESAKRVAIGDATTLASRRQKALEYFQKMGVSLDRRPIATR